RLRAMRLAPVWLLAAEVGGNFMASLHSNYVVHLDFDSSELVGEDVKTVNLAKGQRKFRCRLPGAKNSSEQEDTPDAKKTFLAAKLAPYRGTCLRSTVDFWHYDLCSGSRVVQYRDDAGLRFSLGAHQPEGDRLLPTGEVRELYLFGAENRSTEVRYICGPAVPSFEVIEEPLHHYIMTVQGPAFCTWKENDGAKATTPNGTQLLVTSLYCYPTKMIQFHLEGDKRAPQYTLGALEGPSSPHHVEMGMIKMGASMSMRERRAPPSRHLTLEQKLGGGDVCDETNRHRKTTINFRCPADWQNRPETRIAGLTESSLCEYNATRTVETG
ncbi:unnamed protein product, partial [Durusdinium trenchii]